MAEPTRARTGEIAEGGSTDGFSSVVFPALTAGPTGREAEVLFIRESNLIEDEPGDVALVDAWNSWWNASRFYVPGGAGIALEDVLNTHSALMKTLYPEIAGKFRDVYVGVGVDLCPPPRRVKPMLTRLLRAPGPTTEDEIRRWHIDFEKIHPFKDGNGRVGRIIMNAQRLAAGLPILIIRARDRHEYYRWFHG